MFMSRKGSVIRQIREAHFNSKLRWLSMPHRSLENSLRSLDRNSSIAPIGRALSGLQFAMYEMKQLTQKFRPPSYMSGYANLVIAACTVN
jgi:hypothetical protein